jgi:hypothetical protein
MSMVRIAARLAATVLLALPVLAQAQRDPTQPPLPAGDGVASAARPAARGWPVLIVDGRPHLVVNTRLYAEGQMLGRARIERITETEVWLREGKVLRKIQNYPAVRRTALPPAQP